MLVSNFQNIKTSNFFDVFDIGIKIQFFRVLVTIEPGRSLLQFVTTNCLILVLLCIVLLMIIYTELGIKRFK